MNVFSSLKGNILKIREICQSEIKGFDTLLIDGDTSWLRIVSSKFYDRQVRMIHLHKKSIMEYELFRGSISCSLGEALAIYKKMVVDLKRLIKELKKPGMKESLDPWILNNLITQIESLLGRFNDARAEEERLDQIRHAQVMNLTKRV